jgi:hypothetical protein
VISKFFPALWVCHSLATAATLEVGPGKPFVTLQSAVDAAAPGDHIVAAPGRYEETLRIGVSPLTLSGARAGTSARGRVAGNADPAVETIIAPPTGSALVLDEIAGVMVDGLVLEAAPAAGSAVVVAAGEGGVGFTFANNLVQVGPAAAGAALQLAADAGNATLRGNVFSASTSSAAAVLLDGAHVFTGLHFLDNDVIRAGLPGGAGLAVDGPGNVAPGLRAPRIAGNRFAGHGIGLDGGSRSLQGVEVAFNNFENNLTGMLAGPADCSIMGNCWKDHAVAGLRLGSGGDLADPSRGARGNRIEGNEFESNATDLIYEDQADAHLAGNRIQRNRFSGGVGIHNLEPSGTLDARFNHWGDPAGPAAGAPVAGAVAPSPWYADEAMTILAVTAGEPVESISIAAGETLAAATLELLPGAVLAVANDATLAVSGGFVLPAGARLELAGGSASLGKVSAAPDAVIEVVDGDLSFDPLGTGQSHTIAGSFTFFHCLGSLHIHANTSFSGSTLGIASDIHVAPGVTLIVLGSLVLDGCRLDSTGTFNLLVNLGATFRMTRCDVTGAFITLVGSDVLLRDSVFRDSSITAFSTVSGAAIFHNVFEDGTGVLNVLPGAGVTTTAEGWGNVDDPAAVRNRLSLDFRAPVDPTRTLDAEGNLYVQPGDPVVAGIDVALLVDKAQAVEAVLGYSTDRLTATGVTPTSAWPNGLYQEVDGTAAIGRFNTAVGLAFEHPDPDGSLEDAAVADLAWTATALEGETRVFFREHSPADLPLPGTRITASTGGVPYFRETPFTRNSGMLVVDGTVPEFASGATAVQMRDGSPADVLLSGTATRQGDVVVTFDVRDLLAGIDLADVAVELVGGSATLTGSPVSSLPVVVGGEDFTRHVFAITVDATAPNGLYDLRARAMDRSGNEASLLIGTVEIQKNRIEATVAPQGLVSTAVTRDVTFVATDGAGSVLATWTVAVDFLGGLGTTLLEEVPDGTVHLSAKMAWNLRRRLPAGLDVNGQGSVSFTGAASLRGGDLNGNNLINSADYNLLSVTFPGVNPVADITANGVVNSGDYNILAANWLTAGDPP